MLRQNIKTVYPFPSDMIMEQLKTWDISYRCFDHVALMTVEDSKKVQSLFLSSEQGGGHIKNLYLRDHKKQNILLVAEQDRKIDLKSLSTLLGTGRLSFGSADRLLGKPGCSSWCCNTPGDDHWC